MVADCCNRGRALADLPANVGTPRVLAQRIRKASRAVGLGVKVLSATKIEQLGMGLLQAVGAGSTHASAVVILEHRPARTRAQPIVLVGKGVTHDTGGFNLKRSRIHEMSYDKTGATALYGAMLAIARHRLPLHVVAVLPFVENTLSATATKPGDIVNAMDGTSVCIEDTDAEGRLVLADCISYANEHLNPRAVVDIASLTQAAHLALGDEHGALFANDETLRDLLIEAGEATGEPLWAMPLGPAHVEALRHGRAHLSNVGGDGAQASTAAAFIQQFTRGPWAHIDISAKGFAQSEGPHRGAGATGYGTRLLFDFAKRLSASTF